MALRVLRSFGESQEKAVESEAVLATQVEETPVLQMDATPLDPHLRSSLMCSSLRLDFVDQRRILGVNASDSELWSSTPECWSAQPFAREVWGIAETCDTWPEADSESEVNEACSGKSEPKAVIWASCDFAMPRK
mmetsp:Transcript_4993/g.11651  ORF Transcript_4993/g.11651 Transcript_4993/m.11651 type:complete len:135 (-) Transcript_4993:728-1132(-)